MTIKVKEEQLEQIRRHGEQSYPNECCGLLIGTSRDGVNILSEAYPTSNEWEEAINRVEPLGEKPASEAPTKVESQKNRYWITPEQYKRADTYARGRKLGIIGYYHSHPDHPAAPSGYDFDHSCWPGESYIIVSVDKGKAATLNSFTKPDYSGFSQEEIIIEEG